MAISRSRKVDADPQDGPAQVIEDTSKVIDVVPQGADYKQLMANEAFMNEWVIVMLHPTMDTSEVGVPVSVNGIRAYLVPGRNTRVRRFHVVQLLKARPDVVIHRSDDKNAPESELNKMSRQSTSRYNFDIVHDTPKGTAWYRELREHHYQK